jgi:hypothetical protein
VERTDNAKWTLIQDLTVDLTRAEILVSKQFLYGTDAASALESVRRQSCGAVQHAATKHERRENLRLGRRTDALCNRQVPEELFDLIATKLPRMSFLAWKRICRRVE